MLGSDLLMCQECSGYAYKLRFLEHVVLVKNSQIIWLNSPFVSKWSSTLDQTINKIHRNYFILRVVCCHQNECYEGKDIPCQALPFSPYVEDLDNGCGTHWQAEQPGESDQKVGTKRSERQRANLCDNQILERTISYGYFFLSSCSQR